MDGVLVCLAELVWKATGPPEKDERRWFYVDDGENGIYSNRDCTTLRDVAKDLANMDISSEKIFYEPPKVAEILFIDGYFGRPGVPDVGYFYRALNEKQRKTLEKHLARMKDKKIPRER